MKLIAFVLALLLFMFAGFLFGVGCAAGAHTSIMRGIACGNTFTVDGKQYRGVEVE